MKNMCLISWERAQKFKWTHLNFSGGFPGPKTGSQTAHFRPQKVQFTIFSCHSLPLAKQMWHLQVHAGGRSHNGRPWASGPWQHKVPQELDRLDEPSKKHYCSMRVALNPTADVLVTSHSRLKRFGRNISQSNDTSVRAPDMTSCESATHQDVWLICTMSSILFLKRSLCEILVCVCVRVRDCGMQCSPSASPEAILCNSTAVVQVFHTIRDRKNHGSQRRDRILRILLRPEIGHFSPHFGVLFHTKVHNKPRETGKHPREKIQKSSGEGAPKLQISVPCRG